MNEQRLTHRFIQYASCGSESFDERAFCLLLEEDLRRMGLTPVRQEAAGRACGSNGWNIYARWEGSGEPLLLSAHLDTVSPGKTVKPRLEDGVIRSDGTSVLGGDDKSGIAAALEAVESVMESGAPHRPIELLFSVCEEVGLLGAKHADYSMIASKEAIVLDTGTVGEIVNRSPAYKKLHFAITGKGAHAAVAPHEGIHALKAAAQAIAAIPCGAVGTHSVANVANLQSPGKTNIVAERATFDAEVRSHSLEELHRLSAEMIATVEAACKEFGAALAVTEEVLSDCLYVPEDSPLIASLSAAIQKAGSTPQITSTFGGCDATWLWENGIAAVNTGTGMANVHSCDEHIAQADLCRTAQILEGMIQG